MRQDSSSVSRFDSLAADWDVAPMHLDRTRDVARLMERRLGMSGWTALEVGAGTGLLSFALADRLGQILATDPSQGMVDALEAKIRRSGLGNIRSMRADDTLAGVEGRFDLVMLQMALHHIVGIDAFLERAWRLLAPSGVLAIADLDPEDGSFHGPDVLDVHRGFDREVLRRRLELAGFGSVEFETAHAMVRQVGDGSVRYPIFLCISTKRSSRGGKVAPQT